MPLAEAPQAVDLSYDSVKTMLDALPVNAFQHGELCTYWHRTMKPTSAPDWRNAQIYQCAIDRLFEESSGRLINQWSTYEHAVAWSEELQMESKFGIDKLSVERGIYRLRTLAIQRAQITIKAGGAQIKVRNRIKRGKQNVT